MLDPAITSDRYFYLQAKIDQACISDTKVDEISKYNICGFGFLMYPDQLFLSVMIL